MAQVALPEAMTNAPQQPPTLSKRDATLAVTRDRARVNRGEIALAVALTVCAVGFSIAAVVSTRGP